MNRLEKGTFALVRSCEGNPVTSTVVVMLFYLMFNMVEAQVERLIFGERFQHMLDPIFTLFFMFYAAYTVYWCAIYQDRKIEGEG